MQEYNIKKQAKGGQGGMSDTDNFTIEEFKEFIDKKYKAFKNKEKEETQQEETQSEKTK